MTKANQVPATTAAIALILKKKDIDTRTAALKTSAKDMQHEVHVLACSVLSFVAKHRNMNVLTQFLDAMPEMVRVNSLMKWFETFGELTYGPLNEGDKPSWRFDASKKWRIGEAMVQPFWKFKALEGAAYIPLDFNAWANAAIKKLEADSKATGRDYSPLIMALKTHHIDAQKTGVEN